MRNKGNELLYFSMSMQLLVQLVYESVGYQALVSVFCKNGAVDAVVHLSILDA